MGRCFGPELLSRPGLVPGFFFGGGVDLLGQKLLLRGGSVANAPHSPCHVDDQEQRGHCDADADEPQTMLPSD